MRHGTRIAFVMLASLLCVAAPTLELFVGARVLQGAANAFITPLLVAGLTEVIAPHRLGRAHGVYSSFQAAGSALAPFAAGLAAVVVLGHPDYYPRFGFASAKQFGIGCEYEVPDDVFQARELVSGSLRDVAGTARYHPAFGGV